MTASELLKESSNLRKGFKLKYLLSLILYTAISISYLFLVQLILTTTTVFEKGMNNAVIQQPFFEGNEHLNFIKFKPIIQPIVNENAEERSVSPFESDAIYSQTMIDEMTFSAAELVKLLNTGLVQPILFTVLATGLFLIGLDRARKQKFRFISLIMPIRCKWHLLVYYYIINTYMILATGIIWGCGLIIYKFTGSSTSAMLIALILALVPVYYFFTHSYFANLLIYSKKMNSLDALRTSHTMVTKNLKVCAWFAIHYFIQSILSAFLIFIPLFWIFPKFAIGYGLLFDRIWQENASLCQDQ